MALIASTNAGGGGGSASKTDRVAWRSGPGRWPCLSSKCGKGASSPMTAATAASAAAKASGIAYACITLATMTITQLAYTDTRF